MRSLPLLIVLAAPFGAAADVIHLADGQAISGTVRSCEGGDIIVEPPASSPVLVKVADVASGEGPDIERCLGGKIGGPSAGRGRWYGGPIIIAELSSLLLIPLGAGAQSVEIVLLGVSGVLLSPSIVHLVYGNPGAAAASLGIHLGLGVGGFFLGVLVTSCETVDEVCGLRELGGAAIGVLVSQIVATAIDLATFAYQAPTDRIAVGLLLREGDREGRRASPAGVSLTIRF